MKGRAPRNGSLAMQHLFCFLMTVHYGAMGRVLASMPSTSKRSRQNGLKRREDPLGNDVAAMTVGSERRRGFALLIAHRTACRVGSHTFGRELPGDASRLIRQTDA